MSKAQPTGDLRGLILPFDLRGATLTATSQASPRAGLATPSQATSLTVEACGDLSTAQQASISIGRAGVPEPYGGTFRWRASVSEQYRDWDPPTVLSGWQFIDRSTTAGHWTSPHAVRFPSGLTAVVVTKDSTSVVVWTQGVNGAWTSVTIEDTGNATVACLDVLPSGEVRCWYTVQVASGSPSTTQIRMAYSLDNGATWTVGAGRTLFNPLLAASSTIDRIRVRWVNGSAVAFAHINNGADYWRQWSSSDGGATFYDVGGYAFVAVTAAAFDLVVHAGTIYLAVVTYDATLTGSSFIVPKLYTLGAPGISWRTVQPVLATASTSASEWGVWSGAVFTASDLALLVDDDGLLYCYGVDYDAGSARECITSRSADNGATWIVDHAVWTGLDTSTYLKDITVAAERGRAILFHRFAASPGTADDSLCAAYLGGWSTQAIPEIQGYVAGGWVAGWTISYLPMDKPDDIGATWTKTATGTPSAVLASSGLNITQAGGEQLRYIATPTVSPASMGLFAEAEVIPDATRKSLFGLRISNGTNAFEVQLEITTTSITLTDVATAGTIGSAVTGSFANGVVVRIALQNSGNVWTTDTGEVRASYRTLPAAGPTADVETPDRQWSGVAQSTTVTHAAVASSRVVFGMESGAGSSTWRRVHYMAGDAVLFSTLAKDGYQTRGRTMCPPTSPGYVGRYGLRIQATGGPGKIGDTWSIPEAYDYPIAAVDPWQYPSPQRTWRSTTDATQQDIIWTGADLGLVAGDLVAIYLQGCNFKTASLYADSGAVTKIADINMALATGLGFTRTRGVIYPTGSAGTDSGLWFDENMLAGCHWTYSVGGTVRAIRSNTPGSFRGSSSAATSYAGTRIHLTDYAGGDSASGTTGQIWSDRVIIVTDIATSTDTLMLRIPVQGTAEGYFQVGVCAIGRLHLFGQQYTWGRAVEQQSGIELVEGISGGRRSVHNKKPRRAVEFGWQDGVDISQAYNGTAPDYFTLGYTSAPPVGVTGVEVPGLLRGIMRDDVATIPIVYVPQLPQAAAAPTSTSPVRVVYPDAMLYGRLVTDTLRTDTVIGNEYSNPGEVVRVGTVRIEEEV